jgi:hypothetical protein
MRAERDEARAALDRAARVHGAMTRSLSWRLTKPLRAAKSKARQR